MGAARSLCFVQSGQRDSMPYGVGSGVLYPFEVSVGTVVSFR